MENATTVEAAQESKNMALLLWTGTLFFWVYFGAGFLSGQER